MDTHNLRWWGWGTLDQAYSLESRSAFWSALREWLGASDETIRRETPPVSLEEVSLRPSRLDDPVLSSLCKLLGEGAVRTDELTRIEHACGKSYGDLIRIRAGCIPNPPDAVVYPAEQCKVVALLAWAADRDIAVIPFGGGSTILGDVEPASGDGPTITLDLAKLDRVLSVDAVSRTARIQAGATGPEIEAQLNAQSFTLGHFPQSFEFSTLGGWIATRSVGQNAVGYGGIEDMTRAVRAVTPAGVFEMKDAPAMIAGPNLLQQLVGSEGAFGVITEATMSVHPLPEVQDYRCVLFPSLGDGVAACRDLAQSVDLSPSILRLLDAAGAAVHVMLDQEQHRLRRLTNGLVERYLKVQGYDPSDGSTLLLAGFDGSAEWAARQWGRAQEVCADHHGRLMGRTTGQSWMRDRYTQPYLRDALIGHGVMVGKLETATSWSKLMHLYETTVTAVRGSVSGNDGGPGYVMVHICPARENDVSLTVTFMGRQVDDPDPLAKHAQWQEIKREGIDAIVAAGGTLAQHYGLGRDCPPWLESEIGPLGVQSLQALKQVFDPSGIMNPGILLPS
jgi:alkyldihydroxyacetonephosphate synthase